MAKQTKESWLRRLKMGILGKHYKTPNRKHLEELRKKYLARLRKAKQKKKLEQGGTMKMWEAW